MLIHNKKLVIEQIDCKLAEFSQIKDYSIPAKGWIFSIRKALGMTRKQLAEKMGVIPAAVQQIEEREAERSITLKKLAQTAHALDCRLVYALIPKEGSLEKMIEKRAFEIAKEIVMRTSQTMKLENQENSSERLQKAIKDRAEKIKYEMPKFLWD